MFSGILLLLSIFCRSSFLPTAQKFRAPLLTPTVMQTHANSRSASIYRSCKSHLLFCTHANATKGTIFAIASSKGVVQTVIQNENFKWVFIAFLKKILLNLLNLC